MRLVPARIGGSLMMLPLIVVLLAGCGGVPTLISVQVTPTPSPTPSPTPTPFATPLPTVSSAQLAQGCSNLAAPVIAKVAAGLTSGLAVETTAELSKAAYPGNLLPDDLPSRPYQVPTNVSPENYTHPVNPTLDERSGGYRLTICNPSSTAHTIQRVVVRIASVAPAPDQINEWVWCKGAYTAASGANFPHCLQYENFADEYLHAPFATTASAGDVVTAIQTANSTFGGYGPMPVTLRPGQSITFLIGIGTSSEQTQEDPGALFSTPGYYTFAFALGIDGHAPVYAANSPVTLLAPSHGWSGENCGIPDMQANIPAATTPPTYYVCP